MERLVSVVQMFKFFQYTYPTPGIISKTKAVEVIIQAMSPACYTELVFNLNSRDVVQNLHHRRC